MNQDTGVIKIVRYKPLKEYNFFNQKYNYLIFEPNPKGYVGTALTQQMLEYTVENEYPNDDIKLYEFNDELEYDYLLSLHQNDVPAYELIKDTLVQIY